MKLYWLSVFLVCGLAGAQEITVTLLNGRNAKPVKHEVLSVRFGETAATPSVQGETDDTGTARFSLPTQQNVFAVELSFSPKGRWMVDCRPLPPAPRTYRISDALSRGLVSQNTCGKIAISPTPANIVLFARPAHWWEKLRE